jgi:hypothetical protein
MPQCGKGGAMIDTYIDFKEKVVAGFQAMCQPDEKVMVRHVLKNNAVTYDGLTVVTPTSNISPTIYLDSYYEEYEQEGDFEQVFQKMTAVYKQNRPSCSMDVSFFTDFERIRPRIAYKLVNYEQNLQMLGNVPYIRMFDLAIVFYCLLQSHDGTNASILIHTSHMEYWNVTEEDLFTIAAANTPRLLKSEIRAMSDILQEISGTETADEFGLMENGQECERMYVLSNTSRINGACCILYENLLEQFCAQLGQNVYILPCSIHEVILVPEKIGFTKAEFEQMVYEVNRTQVAKEEVLSDSVYYYSYQKRMLTM